MIFSEVQSAIGLTLFLLNFHCPFLSFFSSLLPTPSCLNKRKPSDGTWALWICTSSFGIGTGRSGGGRSDCISEIAGQKSGASAHLSVNVVLHRFGGRIGRNGSQAHRRVHHLHRWVNYQRTLSDNDGGDDPHLFTASAAPITFGAILLSKSLSCERYLSPRHWR